MANNKDFKVKNGIQPTVYHEGVGTVTSGSVGYYLAGASYDSVSFSLSSETTVPTNFWWKPDGTKVFVLDQPLDTVFQYSLSTAWDISTASYDSKSFSVSGQLTIPWALALSNDGTKMFVVGNSTDKVFSYSLSTAWDVSTASYDSVEFSVTSQEGNPSGIYLTADGTKFFITGSTFDTIFQYSMSTANDLSTASYSSKSFSYASEQQSPGTPYFNSTGTKFWILGNNPQTVHEYSLTTAFDVSTASYASKSFSVSSQETTPKSVWFKSDGTKMFIMGYSSDKIHQYSTALNTATLDLSTGSVFEVTPTSDIQVGLSNPAASGTVSQATLLLDQQGAGPIGLFSTTLYTGNGSTQTITNDIDLAGEGGLVWLKDRFSASLGFHTIYDTEGGTGPDGGRIFAGTAGTNGRSTQADGLQSFDSTGFTLGANTYENGSGKSFVSWTFRQATKFFDVVTYTGDGVAGRTVSHNLGSVPGMIIVKKTSDTDFWTVYHRGTDATSPEDYWLALNGTGAASSGANMWNGTAPTSTEFTVSAQSNLNGNNSTYVAYLFAHDTDSDSNIKCGSFTTDGNGDASVDLGFEAQWVLLKRTDGAQSWWLADTVRGMTAGTSAGTAYLVPDQSYAEDSTYTNYVNPTSTGFGVDAFSPSADYIYVAIRNESSYTITYPSTLEFSGGTAPTSPAIGETDVLTISTTDGGTTYQAVQAIDGAR